MTDLDKFKQECAAFLIETGMSASKFSREATEDPTFYSGITREPRPREPRYGTMASVRAYMSDYRANQGKAA